MKKPLCFRRITEQACAVTRRYRSSLAVHSQPTNTLYKPGALFTLEKAEEKSVSLYHPWKIRHLKSTKDIQDAQSLLYHVYVKEMGWMFAKDSPTGFRIEISECGKEILTDNLGSHSQWFGVKYEDNVVAVMRQVYRNSEGHLDLTRYESSKKPAIRKYLCPSYSPKLIELQRCAVKKQFRGTNVLPCLFHYLFLNAAINDYNVIGTSPVGKMKSFLASTLKLSIIDQNFLYSENIEGPSTCFFASSSCLYEGAKILERVVQSSRYIQPPL